jgi:hypothetical protein
MTRSPLLPALCGAIAAALACGALLAQGAGEPKEAPPQSIQRPPWHDDPAVAPTQDTKAREILMKGIQALGGADAILGRDTIYMKKKVVNHDYPEPVEGTIVMWFKRPDKFRKEVTYPDRHHVEVFDGKTAWSDTGSGAKVKGMAMTAAMVDGIRELDLPVNYLDAELTYFNISQELPGKLAHVVKVRKNGYTRELMFDVDTFLLEVSGEYENPWGATDRMIKFDRYRPVSGILTPHRIEYWRSNRMVSVTEITEVTFNAPIDDALFAYRPEAREKAALP